ncbi:MAG: BamA/TamA family outer membrane protein [bacterium]
MTRRLFPILVFLFLWIQWCHAQVNLQELEVKSLRFEGNDILSDDLLQTVLQTRQSPMWIWKFLYTISEKLGDKPEYFSAVVFGADFERLKSFYEDQGFFNTRIDTVISIDSHEKAVELKFRISEGHRSLIDSIEYHGFVDLPQPLWEVIQLNPLIEIGDPFVMEKVVQERVRLVNAFSNNGYMDIRVDSVSAIRFASTGNMKILFSFIPNKRYQFGPVIVKNDSSVLERVEDEVIIRHLDFAPGDFFSTAKKAESMKNLNRLGVFEASRIDPILRTQNDSTIEIPMEVFVRTRPFHELYPEIGINDENNAFNIVVGGGYSNRNFFGGARNFTTGFRLQMQSLLDWKLNRVFNQTGLRDSSVLGIAEVSAQMVQPYFINNKTTLTPSISYFIDKQKYYYNPILEARISLRSQLARYTTGAVDWNITRVDFEAIDPDIEQRFLNSLSIDRRPQFNSIIALTLQRDKRDDLFNPSAGFVHSATIEESGLLPHLFGGLFGSKLPYSKYFKLSGFGQWYWDATDSRRLIWAVRIRGGFAEYYGSSPAPVPINRRFFAGGSGSIRGWKVRELGAVPSTTLGGEALFEGNLEARWNLLHDAGRFLFLELRKISMVLFVDAGNVWRQLSKVRGSEIAVATGIGIRYETVVGPIRIDFGFRVYDPAAADGQRWITEKRFFGETLKKFVPHFGILHAF